MKYIMRIVLGIMLALFLLAVLVIFLPGAKIDYPTRPIHGQEAFDSETALRIAIPRSIPIKSLFICEHDGRYVFSSTLTFPSDETWVKSFLNSGIQYEKISDDIDLEDFSSHFKLKDVPTGFIERECGRVFYRYLKYPHEYYRGERLTLDNNDTFCYMLFFCKESRSIVLHIYAFRKVNAPISNWFRDMMPSHMLYE